MASVIRVNTINSRSGLSTVTFDNSGAGVEVAGIVTATAFHGDGSQLTGIDATKIITGNTQVQTIDTGSDGHVKVLTEGSERLRIGAAGISTFTNDIRIVKSGGPLLELTTNTGAADATLRLSEGVTGSTSNGGGMFYSGADNKLHITCGTNSTTKRITINRDDGKVGINTTAPADLLSIGAAANTLAFGCKDTTRTNHVWQLLNNDNSGNAEFRMYKNSVSGTHAQSINFATSGDDNYILDGDLGIGTDNPTRKVEIFDTAATVLQLNSTNTGGTSLRIQNSGTDKMYMGLAGDFIVGQTNNVTDSAIRASGGLLVSTGGGNEKLRITSSGYVGINTTTPERYLHIVGNDGATGATLGNSDSTMVLDNKGGNGAMIEFLGDNNGAGHLMFTDTDGSNRGRLSYMHSGDYMRFDVAGQQALTLTTKTVSSTTSAVLGINDTSPTSDALGLVVKNKGSQESDLPVVLIQRDNNAGGGSGTDEIALKINMPYTYNNAGDCYGIKSYVVHNLNASHYAGYFEARGSQYSAGGNGAGIYAQITKTDTNGPGYVPAAFFYGKHTYNASDTGYAMGIRVKVQALTKNTGIMIHHEQTNSDWTPMIRFCKGSGATEVGTIKSSNNATQYNTSSDYRLKENVVDLTGAITRLKQLKPKRFNFKNDTSKTVDGFIAHEVEPVVPQAVSGEKDAVKIETVQDPSTGKTIMLADGTPKTETVIDPQEVDYSKLSTLTIAALQEALAKIETLEAKVAALEGS